MAYDAQYDDETRETYDRATFGGSLTLWERPAVLVVDFSTGFTDPECPMGADMTAAVPNDSAKSRPSERTYVPEPQRMSNTTRGYSYSAMRSS